MQSAQPGWVGQAGSLRSGLLASLASPSLRSILRCGVRKLTALFPTGTKKEFASSHLFPCGAAGPRDPPRLLFPPEQQERRILTYVRNSFCPTGRQRLPPFNKELLYSVGLLLSHIPIFHFYWRIIYNEPCLERAMSQKLVPTCILFSTGK